MSYAKGKDGKDYVVVIAGSPLGTYQESIAVSVKDTITVFDEFIK